MTQRRWFAIAVLMTAFAVGELAAIPSPRPQGWVVDLAGLLTPEDVAQLDHLGDAVHQRYGGALAVLTIPTLAGADPRRFATETFELWQLGHPDRDNGLLIFVAIQERAAEIVLGDGIDSRAKVALSERIMASDMLPRFRNGDPAAAIVAGTRAAAQAFFGVDASALSPSPLLEALPKSVAPPQGPPSKGSTFRFGLMDGVIGGIVLLFLLAIRWAIQRLRAVDRRLCPECRTEMLRLDDQADNAHLSKGQQMEERLGTVSYQVWRCPACEKVVQERHNQPSSVYSLCPQCSSVTVFTTRTTVREATRQQAGLMELHRACQHCPYEHTDTEVIPHRKKAVPTPVGGFGDPPDDGFSTPIPPKRDRSFGGGSPPKSDPFSGGGSSSGPGSSGRW